MEDRLAYKKRFIEGIVPVKSNSEMVGSLIHCLYLEPENFDKSFYISTCEKLPTGKMMDFVQALYKQTELATDESGVVTKEFSEIAEAAYQESGFDWKLPVVLGKFQGKEGERYYNELRASKAKGLHVVSLWQVQLAEKILDNLKSDEFLYEIVNQEDTEDISVYKELQIEGFEVYGLPMKSMIDKIIVDHKNKTIQIVDLKCVWNVENFYEEYYLYRKAYIQAYIYMEACRYQFPKEYKILPPMFLVCDTTNNYRPIVYKLNNNDYQDARDGFTYKNRGYKGVKNIIEELKWAKETGNWAIAKEAFESKAIVPLKTIY